jgi:hypothetical protein
VPPGAGLPRTPIPGPGTTIPGPGRIGKRGISRFPIPAESGIADSLPVSRPNRESGEQELGTSGSGRHHPPSARPVLGSLRRKAGGGQNLHLKESRQHPAQDRACCTHTRRVSHPRFPAGDKFAANRETGDFPIPDSGRVGNRGLPARFPAKSGIGGTGIGDFRV